jgi:acetyl esterase/lipase
MILFSPWINLEISEPRRKFMEQTWPTSDYLYPPLLEAWGSGLGLEAGDPQISPMNDSEGSFCDIPTLVLYGDVECLSQDIESWVSMLLSHRRSRAEMLQVSTGKGMPHNYALMSCTVPIGCDDEMQMAYDKMALFVTSLGADL